MHDRGTQRLQISPLSGLPHVITAADTPHKHWPTTTTRKPFSQQEQFVDMVVRARTHTQTHTVDKI